MKKTVLILHGGPQPITPTSMYWRYFEERGYQVYAPFLLTESIQLTMPHLVAYIKEQLAGKLPDVFVGISMGGLIVAEVAKDYPQAKLVLIATGPRFSPKNKRLPALLSWLRNPLSLFIYDQYRKLPKTAMSRVYGVFNPFTADEHLRDIYNHDRQGNVQAMKQISGAKVGEVITFMRETDMTEVFRKLKNSSIIFSSLNDQLMPLELGEELHTLLAHSRLVVTHGEHFAAYTPENFTDLDAFLR